MRARIALPLSAFENQETVTVKAGIFATAARAGPNPTRRGGIPILRGLDKPFGVGYCSVNRTEFGRRDEVFIHLRIFRRGSEPGAKCLRHEWDRGDIHSLMSRRGQNSLLPVCPIEQNPLGLEFLLSLLRKDSSIQVVRTGDLAGRNGKDAVTAVFVIDNCGLPLPLSECLRRLRYHFPRPKVLILDHDLPREDLLRLLWIKIDGFLPYGEVSRSLLTALHSVAEGNIWVSREVLREYVQWGRELHRRDGAGTEGMTSRENQIIELVKRRLSNKEIADILRIRESTVKFHLSNIYSKLQVGSRHDLIGNQAEASSVGVFPQFLRQSESPA